MLTGKAGNTEAPEATYVIWRVMLGLCRGYCGDNGKENGS